MHSTPARSRSPLACHCTLMRQARAHPIPIPTHRRRLRRPTSPRQAGTARSPWFCDATADRMAKVAGHRQGATADSARLFHGREARGATAAGGTGLMLLLSFAGRPARTLRSAARPGPARQGAGGLDPARPTSRAGAWGVGARQPAHVARLERDRVPGEVRRGGLRPAHHRFCMHLNRDSRLWLSAEPHADDGCEGRPAREPPTSGTLCPRARSRTPNASHPLSLFPGGRPAHLTD